MKKKLTLLLLALLIAAGTWLHLTDYMAVTKFGIARTISGLDYANQADPDEVSVLFCGTGSPNRNPFRASPCLAVLAYGDLYVFDAGEGAIAKLHEFQAPVLRLKKVFLTHLHSDHMSGVAEVLHNTWLYGRTSAVTLVGPPGTQKFLAGIKQSYEDDIDERMYVLGPDGVNAELAFTQAQEVTVAPKSIETVHCDPRVHIEAFQVDHPHWPYAYGYRITAAGKTIVVSGDTAISDGISTYAKNADILIHEALNTPLMTLVGQSLQQTGVPISEDRIARIAAVHTDTLDLADLAADSGVKHLVLTHLIPPVPDIYPARRAFTSGMADRFKGEITTMLDFMDLGKRENLAKVRNTIHNNCQKLLR